MVRRKPLIYVIVACATLAIALLTVLAVLGPDRPADNSEAPNPSPTDKGAALNPFGLRLPDTTRQVVAARTPNPARGSLPNILLITIDSLRGDYLGANGHPTIKTPYIDALSRQGANFTLAFSAFSQTNPSHASLFTGVYPATHQLRVHCADSISDSVATLAELLAQNDYNTSGIYSWPCFEGDFGFDRGFDYYRGVYIDVPGEKRSDRSVDGRADVTTDGVLEWARLKPGLPYFLWVHYMDPHYPYTPPPPFDTMYDADCRDCLDGSWDSMDKIFASHPSAEADIKHVRALYAGEVSFTDQEIGRLLTELGKAGLLDNTMVILTADHGEALSENGYWFHPWIVYNTVVRVPLIVSYPQRITPGTIDDVVRTVDIMPTILSLAGIPIPTQTDGESLWPLVERTRNEDRTAIVETPDDSLLAVVTNEWKLIKNLKNDESALFRTKTDPGEMNDLAASNPEVVSALEATLKTWLAGRRINPPVR